MYYSVNGKSYWLEVTGSGEPVLLLHGFTGSSRTWDVFTAARQQGFCYITVDLPGHGKTELFKPVTMEVVCNDLASILNQLGIAKAHVVGYSMGGRTALSFAMLFPEKVASLVLESASPGLQTEQERSDRQKKDAALAQRLLREGLPAFVNYWEELPLFQTQKKLPDKIQQQIRQERLNQTEVGLAASLEGMGTGVQPSWWEALPSLKQPVLLLTGEADSKFVKIAGSMHERLPNSRLHIVAETGHAIHVEQSEKFGTIVNGFLATIKIN